MLDVTTNQNMNCMSSGIGTFSSGGLVDDVMDPFLMDDDWLHEHNLDVLFDMFEEEMERKDLDHHHHHHHYQLQQHHIPTQATNINLSSTNSSSSSSASSSTSNSNSSSSSTTLFGTSPVTSYLFGTSPSLASALDLYDLLYFDNQQQQPTISSSQTTTCPSSSSITANTNSTNNTDNATHKSSSNSNTPAKDYTRLSATSRQVSGSQNGSTSTNHTASPITNAMRIKRRMKKGQSEGVSLLAKPLGSNSACSSNNIKKNSNINYNNSDKTSTKLALITNSTLKKPISNNNNNNSNTSLEVANKQQQRNRHLHHYHHHVHYITGCSIIREHAYAVRGH